MRARPLKMWVMISLMSAASLTGCAETLVELGDSPAGQDMADRPDPRDSPPDQRAGDPGDSPRTDMPPDLRAQDMTTRDMTTRDMTTRDLGPAPDPSDMMTRDMMTPGWPIGQPCAVQGRAGTCQRVAACVGDQQPTPGHCPGPSDIQCCTPKPTQPTPTPTPTPGTCDPAAMPRPNEGLVEAPGLDGCPSGMVRVTTFCVDRYEASLVEDLPDGRVTSWSPFFNPGTRALRAVSIAQAIPQGYISGDQADAACRRAGKRLCTSAEWLRACQGPQGWTYPYGATLRAGLCHDSRAKHPVVEYFNSTDPSIWSKLGHPCINQQADTALPGDARPGCVSAEGAYHMMGNLHEWVADASGTFRGGFFADTTRNGPGCLYRTTAHNRQHWDYSTGFRCCASLP